MKRFRGALIGCIVLGAAPVLAVFEPVNPDVGPEAMGGVNAVDFDNAGAVFFNPAGLAMTGEGQAGFSYGKPWAGVPGISLTDMAAGVVLPFGNRGGWGLGISQSDSDGLMKDQQVGAGLAFRFPAESSVGVGVHSLKRSYFPGEGDPGFEETSASAVGLDAGWAARFRRWSAGISVLNLNRPDIGVLSEDRQVAQWRGGAGYFFPKGKIFAEGMREENWAWSVGGEWDVLSELALRAGVGKEAMTAGFGVSWKELELNYAYRFPWDAGDSGGDHRFSLQFHFLRQGKNK